MELIVCEEIQDWVSYCHNWFLEACGSGVDSFYLPAGNTPIPLYKYWEQTQPAELNTVQLIQLDDVITPPHQGLFRRFFEEQLPSWQQNFASTDDYHQGKAAILGLGVNGHIGFHEPGLPGDLFQACIPLSARSCDTLGIPQNSWGQTYGLGAIMQTSIALLIVTGKSKQEILQRALDQNIATPATYLIHSHPNLFIVVDQEAAPE